MKNIILTTLKDFFHSFNNFPIGMSGKKLTVAAITVTSFCLPIVLWAIWAYKHNDWQLLTGILVIVSSLITALFSANIVDKFKNPTSIEDKPKDDATKP